MIAETLVNDVGPIQNAARKAVVAGQGYEVFSHFMHGHRHDRLLLSHLAILRNQREAQTLRRKSA